MRTDYLITRFAAVAALVLVLGPMIACNDLDDADSGEAVVEVTATTLAGNDLLVAEDVFATLTLSLQDRSGIANSFFNDVLFTSYTVSFTSDGVAPVPATVNGLITTNACPIGGTCDLTLFMVAEGARGGSGTAQFGLVRVQGMDLNGNPVRFTHQVVIPYGNAAPPPGICDTGTGLCTAPPASVGNVCTSDTDC
jgi:hypothetical protein